jgi:hypothetical protein
MRRLAVVGAVLAALSVVLASAAADATTSDNVAKIVLSGAQTTPDGDVWVGSQMTRQGESQVITVHTLRGIPGFLFHLSRLRVDVAAFETANDYGEPGLATDPLHH